MRNDHSFEAAWRDLNRRSTILRLHSGNVSPCLPAERSAPAGGVVFRRCARLDGRDRMGWKPNGELRMSALQRGILRELVLLQAAQAELRPLQPHQVGERSAAAGRDRILAAAADAETRP